MSALIARARQSRHVRLIEAVLETAQRNHIERHAAAIAFFGMLSLLPLVALVVSAAPPLIQRVIANFDISQAIVRLANVSVSNVTGRWLGEVLRALGRNTLAVDAAGLLGFGWGALKVFGQIDGAFRRIWRDGSAEAVEGSTLRAAATAQITQRGRAALLLVIALADFGVNSLAAAFLGEVRAELRRAWVPIVMPILITGLTWACGALFTALLFRFFIPGRPAWKPVILTAMLVSAANIVLRFLVVQRFLENTLGASAPAVGGPIALLLWAFLLAQNLLLGVALIRVTSR